MKIAIIDDCNEDRTSLTAACLNWADAHNIRLACDCYPDGETFLKNFMHGKYHLLFMDIYMRGLTGIETARSVRTHDVDCLLVFLTTSREHTWEAFPLHPFDYLTKPYTQEQIALVLAEACRVFPHTVRLLELTYKRQKLRVPYSELIALESSGHYVYVTSSGRDVMRCSVTSFSDLWDILCADRRFLLCNRGIILNMDYIEKYSASNFILKNGQSFPIRQNRRSDVIDTFFSYQYERAREYKKRDFR